MCWAPGGFISTLHCNDRYNVNIRDKEGQGHPMLWRKKGERKTGCTAHEEREERWQNEKARAALVLLTSIPYSPAPRGMLSMRVCVDQVILWAHLRDCLDTLVNTERPSLKVGSSTLCFCGHRKPAKH